MVAAPVASPLEAYHDNFPYVYYNKFYYDKLCLAPVMKGRERRRAFGSR
jgi:hypothetical protein